MKSHLKSESVSTLHMTQMLFVTFKNLATSLERDTISLKLQSFQKL